MSFSSFATITISTERASAVVDGHNTAPATYLENVAALPPMPPDTTLSGSMSSAAVIMRPGLVGQPIEIWESYVENQTHTQSSVETTGIPDIKEGDIFIANSVEYEVKYVANWPATNLTGFIRVVLEENKKQ